VSNVDRLDDRHFDPFKSIPLAIPFDSASSFFLIPMDLRHTSQALDRAILWVASRRVSLVSRQRATVVMAKWQMSQDQNAPV
jgi:hypothetical protein